MEKTGLYLIAIIACVAIVGLVILVLNYSGSGEVALEGYDTLAGEAYRGWFGHYSPTYATTTAKSCSSCKTAEDCGSGGSIACDDGCCVIPM